MASTLEPADLTALVWEIVAELQALRVDLVENGLVAPQPRPRLTLVAGGDSDS